MYPAGTGGALFCRTVASVKVNGGAVVCERDGVVTQLGCATCGRPVCPRCLVQTRVGFKCDAHGGPVVPRPAHRARYGQSPRPSPGGFGSASTFLMFPMFFLLTSMLVVTPLEVLFAATGNWTGPFSVVPLVAVVVVMIGGGIVLATKAARSL